MNKTHVIQGALHKSGLYLKKYSPVALSCVASVGVIVTVVTAVKATPKAVELVKADSRKITMEIHTPTLKRGVYVSVEMLYSDRCFWPFHDSLYYGSQCA